jgi:O-antigen ligase
MNRRLPARRLEAPAAKQAFMNKSAAVARFEAFRTGRFWFVTADLLAVLLAILLPWSTSAFLILLVPLLMIICGSLDIRKFQLSIARAPSLVSIGFFLLAALGILWSEAGVSAAVHALGPLLKFLMLPFLLYYFEVSERSSWVLWAFLFSCAVLMINSWIIIFEPGLALKTGRCCGEDYGVSVRNYIDQSQEFSVCLVALFSAALFCIERQWWKSVLLGLTATAFAANLIFVVISRTAIVCIPIMLLVVAWRHAKMRGILAVIGVGGVVLATAWFASPHLRTRVLSAQSQYLEYRDSGVPSSVGKRLEFWHKSLVFFSEAPVFGHGTGSILQLFEHDAIGQSAVAAEVISNPHNQTLSVAIQWGIVGLILLYALWFAHLRMFLEEGLVAELGLIVIVQNIVGSLFNSHLFDFTEGWLYVLGVGVAGGIIARRSNGSAEERSGIAALVDQ